MNAPQPVFVFGEKRGNPRFFGMARGEGDPSMFFTPSLTVDFCKKNVVTTDALEVRGQMTESQMILKNFNCRRCPLKIPFQEL